MDERLPQSPVPLYFRIATAIETAIAGGEYAPGDYLPSEQQLAERFGVSLITVRSAMAGLIDKGLVERRRGKGTMVVERSARAVWELGWLTDLISSVLKSTLDVIEIGNVKAPAWVAKRLGLVPEETVHHMRTVRRAVQRSNEPFMTTDLYHPREIGAALKRADFRGAGEQSQLVVMTLERKCGVTIGSVRQTMSAQVADRDAQKLLGVDAGTALLVVTRDYFAEDGRIVQTGQSRYRTDHYEYVLNLARSTGRRVNSTASRDVAASLPRRAKRGGSYAKLRQRSEESER